MISKLNNENVQKVYVTSRKFVLFKLNAIDSIEEGIDK